MITQVALWVIGTDFYPTQLGFEREG